MDEKKKLIVEKTEIFLSKIKGLEKKKKKLIQTFIEEIHTISDEKTIVELDEMLNELK